MIRLKYVLFYKGHIEAAGRPPKCVCSKNEDLQAKIGENRHFLEIEKNDQKSGISWGVSVRKKGKFYTTFFALLALRLTPDILATFTMETPQQTPTFGVFFVTFNHPRSFNLSEYTITFSITPVSFNLVESAQIFAAITRYLHTPVPEWPQPPLISERSEGG